MNGTTTFVPLGHSYPTHTPELSGRNGIDTKETYMSTAWETTTDDVANVLRAHGINVSDERVVVAILPY
jgi:hypothetical protein